MNSEREDARAGSDDSLESLYAAVPEAEEIDLVQQVIEDDLAATREALLLDELRRLGLEEPSYEPTDLADEPGPSDEPPPTVGQVVGMLEHLLGAEVIDPEDYSDG